MKSLIKSKPSKALYAIKRVIPFDDFVFISLLAASLITRLINLGYNSAFNDEAIYIVIGRMGLFASDWLSYGAKLWMAGLPYIYPAISALAYETAGIVGSRLLNVFFGLILIEEVYQLIILLNFFDKKTNKIAAIIAILLSGFSASGIYTSRLATYDMLSFLLLITSITSFFKAKYFKNGKYYFLTYISMLLAFLTKIITGVFILPLFIISICIIKKRSKKHKYIALLYLYLPFLLSMLIYSLFNFRNLLTFVVTHSNQGLASNNFEIINNILSISGLSLILSVPVTIVLIKYKKARQAGVLLLLALLIPVFHFTLHRIATLEKHMYLTDIFLSVMNAYGISLLYRKKLYKKIFSNRFAAFRNLHLIQKRFSYVVVICLAILFIINSLRTSARLEHQWKNTRDLGYFLSNKIKPGNKILTENGGAVILMLYDKLFPPTDIVTFDWVNYSGITDRSAYIQAVKDGYYDYVELDGEFQEDEEFTQNLLTELNRRYTLIYTIDTFEVYEKNES